MNSTKYSLKCLFCCFSFSDLLAAKWCIEFGFAMVCSLRMITRLEENEGDTKLLFILIYYSMWNVDTESHGLTFVEALDFWNF